MIGKIKEKLNNIYLTIRGESGLSVVEMILILVVIIALVLIFKDQLKTLVETIFKKITSESSRV